MNTLQKYITERLKITSKTKSARVIPTSKEQLQSIIEDELERQGPNADLNFIDTSLITNMSYLLLRYNNKIENIKIDDWDVSNVTKMIGMFSGCRKFNCDLSRWDVSKVINTSFMFSGCENFESDLSGWNTSRVEDMNGMFYGCDKFKSDLSGWNVSKVVSYGSMFKNCPNMNRKRKIKPKFI